MAVDIRNGYVNIQGWMLDYKLKPNELIAFALVYGFSQDRESKFHGSISYIQEWLNCSRHTAIDTMKSLEDKGLVHKEQKSINGVIFNYYSSEIWGSAKFALPVQNLNQGSAKNALGVVQNLHYNNNSNNNIINIPPSAKASPQGDVKKKDELNLSFITPDFLPIMQKWLQYKKERRQSYKQTGIEVCYKKLLNYSDNDLAKATAIIEDAIANNYQGFFRLRDDNENRGHSRQTATRVIPTDRYQLVY